MSDRPIKFNPNGKYNLNFIDYQNEYEAIIDANYDEENPPEESPIYGMTGQEFHALMLQDSVQFRLEQESLEKELMGLGKAGLEGIKKMKVGKTKKECSICLKGFVQGEVIRLLNCNHIFHDGCVMVWFEKKSSCPNCRAEQKK